VAHRGNGIQIPGYQSSPDQEQSTRPTAQARARIRKALKEPRNRFPAWRAGTKTLFDVLARQATQGGEINSMESIPGLLKRLQIRALDANVVGF
jgi:hypothetical protein